MILISISNLTSVQYKILKLLFWKERRILINISNLTSVHDDIDASI